jgi:hypothetical protein
VPTKVREASNRIWLSLLEMPWDEDGRLEVRREMSRLGVSQDDLAYKIRRNGYGVSANTVKAWLRGEAAPRYDGVREIVLVLAAVSAGDSPKASQSSQLQFPEVFRPIRLRPHEQDTGPRKATRQAPRARKSSRAA